MPLNAIKVFAPHAHTVLDTRFLLKWGLPGGGVKSAKVAPTPYVYFPPEKLECAEAEASGSVAQDASSGSIDHKQAEK